ncbi:MAG TPA: 16S rRNA processing protein RimM [Bacteroidales bacterium]|nr:16S rRNA processing protein RimM [Bacteroidales bacterium]
MDVKDCFYLGLVVKPFSYKGELVLFFDVDEPQEYSELDGVYIEISNRLILYPIEALRLNGNRAVVRFENMNEEDSLKLITKKLFLPLDLLPKLDGNKFYFHEVIGFKIIDEEKGDIGIINSIVEYPAQPLFSIAFKEKEILMPVVDQIIQKVDREAKIIYIKAPEGLIDLYLS